MSEPATHWLDQVDWDSRGLVPAIAQEIGSNDLLMFAFMNREALARTAETGEAVYYSRSRQRLWHKGEESGHVQTVHELRLDCDNDVVLMKVSQLGSAAGEPGIACHTGRHSCFFKVLKGGVWTEVDPVLKNPEQIYRSVPDDSSAMMALPKTFSSDDTLARLAGVIESRRGGDPAISYVARLFAKGNDAILKKIGEEATEVVLACKDGEPTKIVAEMADLWFHSMLALAAHGLAPADVLAELERREGLSGLEEFAARKAQQREEDGS